MAIALALGACASRQRTAAPVLLTTEAWAFEGQPAWRIRSPHYLVSTTLDDEQYSQRIAQLMESALGQYRLLAPGVTPGGRPMQCYLFATRMQWARFTAQSTGEDAQVYLQIVRGGYTVRDIAVAYDMGERPTYSVLAHEGWHQFVGRHFRGRLPPFLEEGIACMFEDVQWEYGPPTWDWSANYRRAFRLRNCIDDGTLYPLEKLITLHAGEVINDSPQHIEAFYAQSWGFALFLWNAEGGRYRPALQKLLNDTAAGTVADRTHSHQRLANPWRPDAVKGILENYLAMPLGEIESAYLKYIRQLTRKHGS